MLWLLYVALCFLVRKVYCGKMGKLEQRKWPNPGHGSPLDQWTQRACPTDWGAWICLSLCFLLFEGWIGGRSAMLLQLAFRMVKGFARQRQHVKGHGVISSELFGVVHGLVPSALVLRLITLSAILIQASLFPCAMPGLKSCWIFLLSVRLPPRPIRWLRTLKLLRCASRDKKLKPLLPEFNSVHRVTCLEGSFPPLPSKFSHAWKVPPHCRVIPPISCFPIASRVIRAPRQGEVDARDDVTSYFQSSSVHEGVHPPASLMILAGVFATAWNLRGHDNAPMGKQTLHSVGSLQLSTASFEQVFVHKGWQQLHGRDSHLKCALCYPQAPFVVLIRL